MTEKRVKKHSLKIYHEYFESVKKGLKSFELRKNDRDFNKGDILRLEEWDPQTKQYTGKKQICKISYILKGPLLGLSKEYCIMSIKLEQIYCSKKYPYTCSGTNEPCRICGHLGKYHTYGNGRSFCNKCNE